LGALAAFYGILIGFGPGRDNTAHIAGLLIGIVLGHLMAPAPMPDAPDESRELPHPRPSD
jgi:membrane associated rhomboid family serine protease